MCSKTSGESRAMSSVWMAKPSLASCSNAALTLRVFHRIMMFTTNPSAHTREIARIVLHHRPSLAASAHWNQYIVPMVNVEQANAVTPNHS